MEVHFTPEVEGRLTQTAARQVRNRMSGRRKFWLCTLKKNPASQKPRGTASI